MAKLKIHLYGSPALRMQAQPVEEITDEIRQLVADMTETMDAVDGIGLAATQVGRTEAIFLTRVPDQTADGDRIRGELKVYINPRIISHSDDGYYWSEGCLSLPGIYPDVPRPAKITIEAMDLDGNVFTRELEDFLACNFCHENDHLHGVLTIDRVDEKTKKKLKPKLKAIKQKYRDGG